MNHPILVEENRHVSIQSSTRSKKRYYSELINTNDNFTYTDKIHKNKKTKEQKPKKNFKELKLINHFQKLLITKEKEDRKRLRKDIFMNLENEPFDIIKILKQKRYKTRKNDILIERVEMDNQNFVEYAISNNCMNSNLEMEKKSLQLFEIEHPSLVPSDQNMLISLEKFNKFNYKLADSFESYLRNTINFYYSNLEKMSQNSCYNHYIVRNETVSIMYDDSSENYMVFD